MPIPSQYRVQRWIVRRGPLIAAAVITAGVAVKTLSLIFAVLGLPLAWTDSLGALETVDQVPWPVAILMLLAAWMIVFLGVPLWQKYLAYETRRTSKGEDERRDEYSATQRSKGARSGRPH